MAHQQAAVQLHLIAGEHSHAQVDLALLHLPQDDVDRRVGQADFDGGMGGLEGGDGVGQQCGRHDRRGRHRDAPAAHLHQVLGAADGLLDFAQDAFRMLQEFGAGLGDRELARGPVQQLQAQLAFEFAHQQAGGGLGQVQPPRGRGETAAMHDFDERAHLAQGHIHTAALPILAWSRQV